MNKRSMGVRAAGLTTLTALLAICAACESPARDSENAAVPATPDPSRPCEEGGCEITLSLVTTLSDSAAPGILHTRTMYVERDQRGRFILAAATLDQVVVFDSTGALLGRIGRQGAGPGEFSRISYPVVGTGDSIFVADYFLGRLTVIGPDLEISRMESQVLSAPDIVLDDGHFVVARQISTPEQIGYPLHLMSPSGQLLRSFGTDVPQHRGDLRWLTTRVAGPGANGTIWAAPPGRYVLEQWNPRTGERLQQVEVASDWFVGAPGPHDDPMSPPDPLVDKIFERDGLVWVLLRDKALSWRPPPRSEAHLERPVTAESYDATYDWVFEIVDPATGRVVASRRFDKAPWLNPRSGLLATLRPMDMSQPYVTFDVWNVHLRQEEANQ
jgi:hypothetical protein